MLLPVRASTGEDEETCTIMSDEEQDTTTMATEAMVPGQLAAVEAIDENSGARVAEQNRSKGAGDLVTGRIGHAVAVQ